AAVRAAAPRPLPGGAADSAEQLLRRRPPGQDHDLPRPARAALRRRPCAARARGETRRPARGRPPLRDQRRAPRRARPLLNRLDDADELVDAVAVRAREAHELARLLDDSPVLRTAADRDTASAAELEQAL